MTLTRQYDAWGNLQVGANEPGYAFTGREWDPETGLYYYRARYYDPKVGRFTAEDPIAFQGGVNFYAYVLGNPVRLKDPTGLKCCPKECPSGKWRFNGGFGAGGGAYSGGSMSWGEYQCTDPDKWFVKRSAFAKCDWMGVYFDTGSVFFDQQYWGSAVDGIYCAKDLPPVREVVSWIVTIGPLTANHGGPPSWSNLENISGSASVTAGGIAKQKCKVWLSN